MKEKSSKSKAAENSGAERQIPDGRRFQKGSCPNPGGRPKEIRELKEMAREYTVEAITTFARIMRDEDAPHAARILAADKLLDRGYGRAQQHVTAEINVIEKMGIDELREYLVREAEALGIGSAPPPRPGRSRTPARQLN